MEARFLICPKSFAGERPRSASISTTRLRRPLETSPPPQLRFCKRTNGPAEMYRHHTNCPNRYIALAWPVSGTLPTPINSSMQFRFCRPTVFYNLHSSFYFLYFPYLWFILRSPEVYKSAYQKTHGTSDGPHWPFVISSWSYNPRPPYPILRRRFTLGNPQSGFRRIEQRIRHGTPLIVPSGRSGPLISSSNPSNGCNSHLPCQSHRHRSVRPYAPLHRSSPWLPMARIDSATTLFPRSCTAPRVTWREHGHPNRTNSRACYPRILPQGRKAARDSVEGGPWWRVSRAFYRTDQGQTRLTPRPIRS